MIALSTLLLIFAVLIGSTGMVGMFGYLLSRVRRLEGKSEGAGEANLFDEMKRTRRGLAEVREELDALREAVVFTERLLAEGRRVEGATNREGDRVQE